jgi:hypothetical protein
VAACQLGLAWRLEYRIGTKSTNDPRAGTRAAGHPSLIALLAARDQRRAETAYAASAFFEDDDFSDLFDGSDFVSEDFDESFDSFFSPLSFDRSISRFRRFVP